ncbi:alpha/beta fold hydrolase [Frankia sp. CcI49]|uniref:alpha/beta hydrolase n=1 Tax=Frankia sp. CcI49 TaxID=1745382 RepID=UPI002410DE35|nr:alpha/beta fold hydrolase [Frankia sp. CcI49]
MKRRSVRIAVGDLAPPGVTRLAVRVVADPDLQAASRPVVLCCFPGGGMSTAYFEMDGYDMAAHLAGAGVIVVLVDHPGVGDSDVPDDPWTLRPELVADVEVLAVERVIAGLGLANPVVIGLGHSMGAMLVAYQQARHRPYQGLVLVGYSGRGLPEVLRREELAVAHDPAGARDAIVQLARSRFGRPLVSGGPAHSEMLVGPHASPGALGALGAAAGPLLALCGLTSMLPGSHADELASIDVPVLAGVGDHDIVGPPHEIPGHFPGSRDVTVFVLQDAYHNSNIAPNRHLLWDRIRDWTEMIRERCSVE